MEKYQNNNDLQILFRLYAKEVMKFLYNLCIDEQTIKSNIVKFNLFNSKAQEMKVHKNKLQAVLDKATDPFNRISLDQIAWYNTSSLYNFNILVKEQGKNFQL